MAVLAIVGMVALLIASILLNGIALSVLWGWFLVPLGLSEIGLAHAIGISMVVGLITYQEIDSGGDNRSKDEAIGYALGAAIGRPLLLMALGWLAHLFM